jgi:hypothetical protein
MCYVYYPWLEISALHKYFCIILIVLELYLSVVYKIMLVVLRRILELLLCLLLSILCVN